MEPATKDSRNSIKGKSEDFLNLVSDRLSRFFRIKKKWLWLLAVLALLAGVGFYFKKPSIPPTPTPPIGSAPKIELVGSVWTGFGVPGAGEVSVQGEFAYVAPGEGDFQVIDISNKNKPTHIGWLGVDFQTDVRVEGKYAYLKSHINKFGILVVDISEPANPKYVNPEAPFGRLTWPAPKGITIGDYRVRDGYLYLTLREIDDRILRGITDEPDPSSINVFLILDVRDPLQIREVARLKLDDQSFRLHLNQNHAYVGFINGGSAIIDISNPQSPVLVGIYREKSSKQNPPYLLGHKGNTLILATWQPAILFNIYGNDKYWVDTPPAEPTELIFVDASKSSRPIRTGTYPFPENQVLPWQAVALNNYLYVIDQRGPNAGVYTSDPNIRPRLLTFDIANQQSPRLLNQIPQRKKSHMTSLTRQGDYLYINELNYGVRIFSITNRAQPRYVGGTPTASDGRYVWVNDDETFAYLQDSWAGTIWIIDISNKARPVKRGYYWNPEAYTPEHDKFFGRGSYLYLPGEGKVAILDVSNPELLAIAGQLPGDLGKVPTRITLAGNYVYVSAVIPDEQSGSYEKALFIYDVTQPKNPVLQDRLTISRSTSSDALSSPQIAVDGSYVYLMLTDESTLAVVDVSNPKKPRLLGRLEEKEKLVFKDVGYETGGRLAVSQGHAYILTGEDYFYQKGLDNQFQLMHIVDVRNPSQPVYKKLFADFTDTPYLLEGENWPADLIASGSRLYLGSYYHLTIYDLSDPVNPRYLTDTNSQGVPSPVGYYGQHTGWSLGQLRGQYLYTPTIQGLHIFKITP